MRGRESERHPWPLIASEDRGFAAHSARGFPLSTVTSAPHVIPGPRASPCPALRLPRRPDRDRSTTGRDRLCIETPPRPPLERLFFSALFSAEHRRLKLLTGTPVCCRNATIGRPPPSRASTALLVGITPKRAYGALSGPCAARRDGALPARCVLQVPALRAWLRGAFRGLPAGTLVGSARAAHTARASLCL